MADVTAATTVYFTPYKGNRCALYDGSSQWAINSFTELSIALGSDTANTNWDVFLYLSSGTPTLERVAWASSSTRATALTLQDGVYVKSSDTTRRYVGTYRTTPSAGQTEDSFFRRFIWNYLHRVPRVLRATEATNSWTYTTGVYRQANAAATNQVNLVVGVAEAPLSLRVVAHASNTSASVGLQVSIGEDSSTTPATAVTGAHCMTSPTVTVIGPCHAAVEMYPSLGNHAYIWLERSAATGTTTWYGDNGDTTLLQSGLFGTIQG